MAAPVRYLSGRQQQQKIGIEGNTDNQKVLEVVGQVGIGTTIFEPSKQLDVRGDVNISGQLTVGGNTFGEDTETRNLKVSGLSTFTNTINANGNLDVDGHTELDDVNVSGASTFASAVDINANLDVSGTSTLNDTVSLPDDTSLILGDDGDFELHHIAGGNSYIKNNAAALEIRSDSTIINSKNNAVTFLKANASGLMATTGIVTATQINLNGDLDVDGHTELDDVNVSGASTFTGSAHFNGDIDVDGHTELDNLRVSGVSTFIGAIDADGSLDVDGHTELDDVNVSGVSTLTGNVSFGSSAFFGDNDKINMGDNDDLQIFHHTNGTGVIQNAGSGQLQIRSDEIRLLNQATDENYAFFRDDGAVELYYDNVKRFETTGYGVTVYGGVNVSGVSTFTGAIDANGGANIVGGLVANSAQISDITDNHLVIAGTGGELEGDANLTFNGTQLAVGVNLDVDGHTELDDLNVSGVSTFASAIDANGDIDVNGHTELDDVNVSGVSTFTGTINANGDLDVDGHTELDDVNVSGVSTFTGTINANGDLDVDGHTELDNLNVSGVSTFVGLVTVTTGDVHIANRLFVGGLEVEGGGEGTFTGINTFTNQIDNVLGNSDTGAVHFNGGVGIDKNLTVGAGLSVVTGFEVGGISTFTGNINANGNLDVDGHTELDDVNVSGASTFTGNINANGDLDVDGHTELDNVNASGISSATAFANFDYLQAPFGSTVSFTVTVASKDASHRYNGTGSGSAYLINGVQSPFLTLTPGRTYRFNLSASDQSNHPFRFYLEADKTTQYTTNVTTSATYTEITITDETPVVLHYQCLAHGYMGNAIQTNSNVVNTNYDAILRGGLDVDGHTELDDVNVSGASTFASAIDANNGLDVSGAILNVTSGLVANSAKVSDLISGRVVLAGTDGELEDNSKLTFDGSTLTVQGGASFNGNVTIGGTLTKEDVTDVDSIGLVTARSGVRIDTGGLVVTSGISTFTDNIAGNLTGTATTATNLAGGDTGDIPYQSANGATTFVDASGAGNGQVLLWGGSAPIWASVSAASGNFGGITLQEDNFTVGTASSIIGINFIGDNVTAAAGSGNVIGSVTISDTPTFDSLKVTGISTIPSVTGPTTFSGGDVNVGTAITFDPVSGIVSAIAFYGSGENLTDVLNQKIEGLQVFDEGINVGTGFTFSAIDVVGSNISVAAVGLGTTARITLSDTPTFDTVAVTNDITANGNIVGDNSTNISGINSVTASTLTGTLQTAAQTNITSVGTLGNLTVSGTSTFNNAINIEDGKDLYFRRSNANVVDLFAGNPDGFYINILKGIFSVDSATATGSGNIKFNTKSGATIANRINNTTRLEVNGSGIDVTGIVTATTFSGSGASLTNLPASTTITVADESSDTTCFPLFVTAATGNLGPKSGSNLTFDSSTGTLTATDFNSASDENLKENIRTIENPLAKVAEIRGVNFDWKENQKPSVGVIAQEVEKVFPELVLPTGFETKSVNYNGLIGLLIEVVKDQQTQINSLNERLSQLE